MAMPQEQYSYISVGANAPGTLGQDRATLIGRAESLPIILAGLRERLLTLLGEPQTIRGNMAEGVPVGGKSLATLLDEAHGRLEEIVKITDEICAKVGGRL